MRHTSGNLPPAMLCAQPQSCPCWGDGWKDEFALLGSAPIWALPHLSHREACVSSATPCTQRAGMHQSREEARGVAPLKVQGQTKQETDTVPSGRSGEDGPH